MAYFNLDDYETVETRINRFWEQYPNGRIYTEVVSLDERGVLIKASIYTDRDDERPATIDYAHEIHTEKGVNSTSFIENGCTSAIGRALADLGFSPKGKRPSREEMQKVANASKQPSNTPRKHWNAETDALIAKEDLDGLRALYALGVKQFATKEELAYIKEAAEKLKAPTGQHEKPAEAKTF